MFITDLTSKITNFRVKIGDKLNTLKNQVGQLNLLTTNDKTSLVGAVNEVNRNIPTVNDGQLTLSTGTGLNGSTNFTANQSGSSTFSVAVANTHKLPTTTEWGDTLKKDESNTVTENFEITNGTSKIKFEDSFAISGELIGKSGISLCSDDGFAVYYTKNGAGDFSAGLFGIESIITSTGRWYLYYPYNGESLMTMPITGTDERVLTTGAKVGTTTYYANTQGVIELPEYPTYSAGNGLTLNGTTFSLPVITSGSGNVVSEVTQSTNGITVTKGISAMTTSHLANHIDQNLNKVSSPTFNSIELSATAPFIDFHYNKSSDDYTSRIIENSLGGLNLISKNSLKYNVDGVTTPFLEIDRYGVILGSNVSMFEAVYLKTVFGSINFDDEGFNYRPNNQYHSFGIESNINAYYDIELHGKLNDLKINGRGSLGSPLDLLNGTNLTDYVFADVSNKDALGTFRVESTITKDGGIPVFARWGASILAQTGDTMFTLSANSNTPEIFVSAGNTTNNVLWNKKLAFSVNEFPLYAQAFYENSLRELKENIKPFNKSGIELINSLDIVTFDRKDSEVKNKIGIIADDSIDEVLSTKKDAVDLYNTVFIQAKAIQELDSKNKTLEERISQLEEIIKNML